MAAKDDGVTQFVHQILASTAEDRLLVDLLDALPIGVIALDERGRVVRYNAYEQRLARRSAESVIGRQFFTQVAPCTAASDMVAPFERFMAEGGELAIDMTFQFPFPHIPLPREVRLRLRGFESEGRRFAFLLVEDITEEVQAKRLRELLAMLVAHDMKNPLTAIRLNVDMVMRELSSKGRASDTRVSARLGDARNAAERLDRMIRLFLDVYRLENADLAVACTRVRARALADEVVRGQAAMAEQFGVMLSIEGVDHDVEADASLLQRVLENLIDNAMRHARSRIVVALRAAEGRLELDVIDDGQGVPPEARSRIFDKFASMSADLRGYNQGLGLTFCALAVARMKGSIDVLDAEPQGAVFRVKLPLVGR